MIEELKKVAWISTGGLAIGIIVRHAHDALKGIPDVADSTLVDTGSLLFGASFVALWLWLLLTEFAIIQHRPFKEAKEHYEASAINGGWFSQLSFILIRALSTFSTYLIGYFMVLLFACQALAGDPVYGLELFGGCCVMLIAGWFGIKSRERTGASKPPQTLETNLVRMLGLSEKESQFAVVSLLVALFFSYLQYDKISQSFGGGKPERAILVMRKTEMVEGSVVQLDERPVEILFRRGSKIGIRRPDMKDGQFLILDTSDIASIYVGNGIKDLRLNTP